ncbi:MAG: hypothetical protein PHX34_05295 [Candidatus Shapirobacteria bacterium]|nr:hypothetical protein [Candidatus Shapirobacteria bacterium]
MKISFIIGGLPMSPLSTLEEIRAAGKRPVKINKIELIKDVPGLLTFSDESYWKIKCLEINTEFEKEIIRARRMLGIPDNGLTYSEYLESYSPFTLSDNSDIGIKINNEIQSILEKFNCDDYVKNQLKSILLANIVLPTESDGRERNGISVYSIFNEEDLNSQNYDLSEKAVFIKITSSVKSEAIINFIENNGDKFNTLLSNLPKSRGYTDLSEEKIAILGMKKNNPKTNYNDMAAKWAKLCTNENNFKNKDIKTVGAFGQYYRRTVADLFCKKK